MGDRGHRRFRDRRRPRRDHRRRHGQLPRHSLKTLEPSAVTALVGACYSLGGTFILTLTKWGAALGMVFIAAEILGRIYLVATGVAPSTGPDAIKIALGAAIALALIGYVASQWRRFR